MTVVIQLVVVGERGITRIRQADLTGLLIHGIQRFAIMEHVVCVSDAVLDVGAIGVGRRDRAQRYARCRAFRILERICRFIDDRVVVVHVRFFQRHHRFSCRAATVGHHHLVVAAVIPFLEIVHVRCHARCRNANITISIDGVEAVLTSVA